MRFLARYDGEVSEPLVGRQGSRVSMRMARADSLCGLNHRAEGELEEQVPCEDDSPGL